MRMRLSGLGLTAAVILSAVVGTASASTVVIKEGSRKTSSVSPSIDASIGDTDSTPAGRYDLATELPGSDLEVGDTVEVYGRLVTADDGYKFTTTAPSVEITLTSFEVEPGETGSNTAKFVLNEDPSGPPSSQTFSTGQSGPVFTVASTGGGTTTLDISGDTNTAALYDVSVRAVPLPAAAWLFGTALLGLTTIARRRMPASVGVAYA